MTPQQFSLLKALRAQGGCRDRFGRIAAEGQAFPTETVLWCFLHGWIVSDGERITLTVKGHGKLAEAST